MAILLAADKKDRFIYYRQVININIKNLKLIVNKNIANMSNCGKA